MQGAFCKHQAAIHIKYGINFPNYPQLSFEDKKEFSFLATGNQNIQSSFLEPMMLNNKNHDQLLQISNKTNHTSFKILSDSTVLENKTDSSTAEERKKKTRNRKVIRITNGKTNCHGGKQL